MNSEWGWGRIYTNAGDISRREERVVGKFMYAHVDETNLYDDLAAEEEKYEAELAEERERQVAVQKEKERRELDEEAQIMERIVDKKVVDPDRIERETLRRENETLMKELKKMKELLKQREEEAKVAENRLAAASAEKARVTLVQEKKENPVAHIKRKATINNIANKSFANNVDKEGFAAPQPRRRKFKALSKFAKLGKGKELCKLCDKSVSIGPFGLRAIGSVWHKECFKCGTCSKMLRGEWLEHNGFPYCNRCHKAAFGIKGFGFGGAVAGNYTRP